MKSMRTIYVVSVGCMHCESVDIRAVRSKPPTPEEVEKLTVETRLVCEHGGVGVETFEVDLPGDWVMP